MTKKNFETMTLVYGTGNAAKLEIMKRYLAGFEKIRLVGLKELDFCWEEPEESGKDPVSYTHLTFCKISYQKGAGNKVLLPLY